MKILSIVPNLSCFVCAFGPWILWTIFYSIDTSTVSSRVTGQCGRPGHDKSFAVFHCVFDEVCHVPVFGFVSPQALGHFYHCVGDWLVCLTALKRILTVLDWFYAGFCAEETSVHSMSLCSAASILNVLEGLSGVLRFRDDFTLPLMTETSWRGLLWVTFFQGNAPKACEHIVHCS